MASTAIIVHTSAALQGFHKALADMQESTQYCAICNADGKFEAQKNFKLFDTCATGVHGAICKECVKKAKMDDFVTKTKDRKGAEVVKCKCKAKGIWPPEERHKAMNNQNETACQLIHHSKCVVDEYKNREDKMLKDHSAVQISAENKMAAFSTALGKEKALSIEASARQAAAEAMVHVLQATLSSAKARKCGSDQPVDETKLAAKKQRAVAGALARSNKRKLDEENAFVQQAQKKKLTEMLGGDPSAYDAWLASILSDKGAVAPAAAEVVPISKVPLVPIYAVPANFTQGRAVPTVQAMPLPAKYQAVE
jgi:hypothetical protein